MKRPQQRRSTTRPLAILRIQARRCRVRVVRIKVTAVVLVLEQAPQGDDILEGNLLARVSDDLAGDRVLE